MLCLSLSARLSVAVFYPCWVLSGIVVAFRFANARVVSCTFRRLRENRVRRTNCHQIIVRTLKLEGVLLSFDVTIMARRWRYHHQRCKVWCVLVKKDVDIVWMLVAQAHSTSCATATTWEPFGTFRRSCTIHVHFVQYPLKSFVSQRLLALQLQERYPVHATGDTKAGSSSFI